MQHLASAQSQQVEGNQHPQEYEENLQQRAKEDVSESRESVQGVSEVSRIQGF